jgi:hypothetical protein
MIENSSSGPIVEKLPPVEGVTLEQYAGLSAALLDGFALEPVLALEKLDEAKWAGANLRWSRRIAAAPPGGSMSTGYRAVLAFARDWIGRRVAPLEDDLEAWFAFLAAISEGPTVLSKVMESGVTDFDISRIQSKWHQRMEADAELKKRALKLAAKPKPKIPRLEIRLGALRPFPWSKTAATQPTPTPTRPQMLSQSYLGDAIGLERYAGIHAALSRGSKSDVTALLARHGLSKSELVSLDARWKRRFDADPSLLGDFRALVRYYEARETIAPKAVTRIVEPVIEARVPVSRPPAALVGTALSSSAPVGPVMPFKEGQSPLASARPSPQHAPAGLGSTAPTLNVPRGPATPFERVTPKNEELLGTALLLHVPRELFDKAPPSQAATPAPLPPVTLEHHAAMTAEIAFAPARALEVLARLGVTIQLKRAADAYWRARLDADVATRDAWNRAYAARWESISRPR